MLAQYLALIVAFAAIAQDPQDPPSTRAREILSAPRYQTELPGAREPRYGGNETEGRRRNRRPEGNADGGRSRDSGTISGFDNDGIGFVFWVLLGIAAVAALAWLREP